MTTIRPEWSRVLARVCIGSNRILFVLESCSEKLFGSTNVPFRSCWNNEPAWASWQAFGALAAIRTRTLCSNISLQDRQLLNVTGPVGSSGGQRPLLDSKTRRRYLPQSSLYWLTKKCQPRSSLQAFVFLVVAERL